ncbi:DUF3800 domain-containing protein [Rhizobium sp. 9T]|uniref:DUF3800 domain-containing protein n=1 Tax=Rhizobium croatiense TaxID=2867516 RepID=UPI001C9335EC|nr:DUF3800 domain-containing protein [Rhizobium croatiense]MBY4608994.1 DUF3800 domain-containing protein [Rhizobium croatiense]
MPDQPSTDAPRLYDYIAYIDEAGDPGIRRVMPIDNTGGTEWFSVGCAVIKAAREHEAVDYVNRVRGLIRSSQRPDLHYKKLQPWQRLAACTELAKENTRLFAVVSNKQTMRGYRNPNAEAVSLHPNDYFYNYCIRILLERVTEWVERRSIVEFGEPRKMLLVFSKRGGHSYRHVETYAKILRIQKETGKLFQNFRAPRFTVIDPNLMDVIQHDQNAGLQMADIVASAFYQAAHARALNWDTEPAKALKPRLGSINGRYVDKGLQLLPWRSWTLPLTEQQKEIFRFYGYRI